MDWSDKVMLAMTMISAIFLMFAIRIGFRLFGIA